MSRIPVGTTDYKKGLAHLGSDVRGSANRDVFKPVAINKNGYVYFTYIDYQGDIFITKFKSSDNFAVVKKIAARSEDYNNSNSDVDHGNPSICIDNDGYIYVFYGCHNTPLYYRKSTSPYSIDSWSVKLTVTGAIEASYVNPVVLSNNKIFVFYRDLHTTSTKRLSYAMTSDGGSTWSSQNHIVTPTTTYWTYPEAVVVGTDNSIHVLFAFRDDASSFFNRVTYSYTQDEGVTWKKANGNEISLQINESTDPITTSWAHPADLKLNSSNQPYICYSTSSGVCLFAKWSGSAWDTYQITNTQGISYENCEIEIVSDSIIDAYVVEGTASNIQGGNIARYRSVNGGVNWNKVESITEDASAIWRYFYPKIVKNSDDNCKIIYFSAIPVTGETYFGTNFKFYTYP